MHRKKKKNVISVSGKCCEEKKPWEDTAVRAGAWGGSADVTAETSSSYLEEGNSKRPAVGNKLDVAGSGGKQQGTAGSRRLRAAGSHALCHALR